MDKFYFAKIGKGNSYADFYLLGQSQGEIASEIDTPAIPIYFNSEEDNEDDFLKNMERRAKIQGESFFECGRSNDGRFIVVIHKGFVYILRPKGSVIFEKSKVRSDKKYVKLLPVEILKNVPLPEVPTVLASIGANRHYSSGTFREISKSSNPGNIRAIRSVLGQDIDLPKNPCITHAIECLSSVEFETLIAKAFEEAGCFVPAYRGGTMQGADLFAYNKSKSDISLGRLVIKAGERISIQIKLRADKKAPPPGIDILVACNVEELPNTFGKQWLNDIMVDTPHTIGWLKSSLDWLPPSFIC